MFKDVVVKADTYIKYPNPGLKTYLDKTERGNDEEYRTPFFKGKTLQQVLDQWMPTIDQLKSKWPTLVEFENDLAKKVGPMSIQKPLAERMEDIEHYYEDIHLPQRPIDHSAIKAVLSEWSQVRGMSPRGIPATVRKMKLSTNSGTPYFTKRRNVLDKTVPCTTAAISETGTVNMYLDMQGRAATRFTGAAILGWRGQEGGMDPADVKQRVVWMFPMSVNINELQVYQPLIEQAQKYELVPAWVSMDMVDRRITDMFDTKGADDLVVCTDFSKFDQHFNPMCQEAAKQLLTAILNNSGESKKWLERVFPAKYCIPLIIAWGPGKERLRVLKGEHGMASGSGGTNADETLVHRALQYEAAKRAHSGLNPNSQCLGDDGVLTYPGITVEDVVDAYTDHGLEMNPDKQYASKQDCVYLRRWHHQDYRVDGVCVGVYSTARALGRLCEQERYYDPDIWSKEMVALRQLSILENCKYHPLKEEFVDYCMKGDKFRLGLDLPGFFESLSQRAQEATELMPDFLGYTRSLSESDPSRGIDNWWIVNYLRSKK